MVVNVEVAVYLFAEVQIIGTSAIKGMNVHTFFATYTLHISQVFSSPHLALHNAANAPQITAFKRAQ